MPSTLWSAPSDAGNSAPFVQSTITAAVLDISPGTVLIPAGSIVGRGRFSSPATSWTTAPSESIAPQTVGAQTVAQTATGMITYNEQNIFAGCTVTTATGLTSITCNELTCELIG